MQCPNVANYIECQSYFNDFYELNKNKGNPASFRTLAKHIGWPYSFLSDLIHGRKTLTVPRALEFAKFANFNLVETERLIYMSLHSSSVNEVKSFFSDKLNIEHNSDSSTNSEKHFAGLVDESKTCNEELKNDLAASALLKLLVWANCKIQKKLIGELLHSYSELQTYDSVQLKLDKLIRNGNIEIISDKGIELEVLVLKPTIHFVLTKETLPDSACFSDNLSKLMRSRKASGIFNMGFINIERKELMGVLDKIGIFRNWLLELDKKYCIKKEDGILFQYDMNLVTMIDTNVLGIDNIKTWAEESPRAN